MKGTQERQLIPLMIILYNGKKISTTRYHKRSGGSMSKPPSNANTPNPPTRRVRQMKEQTARLRLVAVTKGALRYQEIDQNGNELTMRDSECIVGTQYLRQGRMRSMMQEGEWPQMIEITVKVSSK